MIDPYEPPHQMDMSGIEENINNLLEVFYSKNSPEIWNYRIKYEFLKDGITINIEFTIEKGDENNAASDN